MTNLMQRERRVSFAEDVTSSSFYYNNDDDSILLPSMDESSETRTINYLIQSTNTISIFRNKPDSVRRVLNSTNWTCTSTDLVVAYSDFIEVLVSDQPLTLSIVAMHIISQFSELDTDSVISNLVHSLIQRIVFIIPASSTAFATILTKYFPHKSEPIAQQTRFLSHILIFIEHTPVLMDHVLSLIVDKLLKIDCEIQVELDDLDEIEEDDLEQSYTSEKMVDYNGDSVDEESEGSSDNDNDDDENNPKVLSVSIKRMVSKMDKMMVIMMEFIKMKSQSKESLGILFQSLLHIFEKTVILTHKSKYTQFLWFYICSLEPSFPDEFLGVLTDMAFLKNNHEVPVLIKSSTVSYLGSYMARAKYLDLQEIKNGIHTMVKWALSYISEKSIVSKKHKPSGSGRFNPYQSKKEKNVQDGVQVKDHTLFYTTIQSILYLFCFRWKDLMSECEQIIQPGEFPLEMAGLPTLLNSKYQPLKICAPTIVEEFSKLAHQLELVYCFTGGAKVNIEMTLDAFFPFDPLPLKLTSVYIDGLFKQWESCVVDEDDDDEEGDTGCEVEY